MDPEEYPGYIFAPRYTAKEIADRRRIQKQNQAIDPQHNAQPDGATAAGVNAAAADAEPPADPDPENRMTQFVWCQCGHCMYIPKNPTLKMCICCQEQNFDGLNSKLDSPDHIIPCITQHQDFDAMCRTNAVLEMMEAFTREKRGYGAKQDWSNRYVWSKKSLHACDDIVPARCVQ